MGTIEYTISIRQELIFYNKDELLEWRCNNPSVVPEKYRNTKGPGLANGYGYSEFVVERHLINSGYEVINNEYNLFARKTSKYKDNNERIREKLGNQKYEQLIDIIKKVEDSGISIWQTDICAFRNNITYFIEAKRDKDILKDEQGVFAILLKEFFNIPFIIYKVLPEGTIMNIKPVIFITKLPSFGI